MRTIEAPVDRPSFAEWFAEIKRTALTPPLKKVLTEMYQLRQLGANVQLFTSNNDLNEKKIHEGFFKTDGK
ncbi:hypothetical protein [Sphingobacterium sp. CZ-UAM]|uniref:hypothetical protein n=1 Tax=Sphingobacterium sp. CZ-UAM TaxID=1933868 RepID=UPI0011158A15|nr:hypothetical protein [Sphingobacterium sp. CZ-UAM]